MCRLSPARGWRRKKSDRLRLTSPLKILKARMRSARRRPREKRLRWRSLSPYGTWRRPLTCHVAGCWTLSSWLISALNVGALASNAYSRRVPHYDAALLLWIVLRRIFRPWKAIVLLYSQPLYSALKRWKPCQEVSDVGYRSFEKREVSHIHESIISKSEIHVKVY